MREAESALADMGENVDNLRTLVRQYGDAIYTAAITRGLWELEGTPVHAVGSAGQLMSHPLLRSLERLEAHADSLARSLNLTPESRSRRRVGAPMGSSTAPDRKGPTRLRKAA
jgi:hypothetical protein